MDRQLIFDPFTRRVLDWLFERHIQAWLVGGTLRDLLQERESHDIDLVVVKGGLRLAQRLADALGAAYFPLDRMRDVGRAVWRDAQGILTSVDVASLRGPSLADDLSLRDYTVNAMAVDVLDPARQIIDPTGGRNDLEQRVLRATSDRAFVDDPLRILRGVRLGIEQTLTLAPGTVDLARRDAPHLAEVAGERVRDELGRLLVHPQAAAGIRGLDRVGALEIVLPEIAALQGIGQGPPHYLDVYEHTLGVLDWTHELARLPAPFHSRLDPPWQDLGGVAPQIAQGLEERLGPLKGSLSAYLAEPIGQEQTRGTMLPWIALLHDIGKPATRVAEEGEIRFPGHAQTGARLAGRVLQRVHAGTSAARLVVTACEHHEDAASLARLSQGDPTRRQVYDYFRATHPAGVEIALLNLADHLATWGPALQLPRWEARVRTSGTLLEAYFHHYTDRIRPILLLDGRDLMAGLGLQPGPRVGDLLDRLAAGQAAGEVTTVDEAWALMRSLTAAPDLPS